MSLPFPSLKFVSIGEQTPPSQSILKISDERINMYNNPNLLRELKNSHINGTLCPKPNTPVVASIFPNPNTTVAAYAPIYHSLDIETSVEECIKEGEGEVGNVGEVAPPAIVGESAPPVFHSNQRFASADACTSAASTYTDMKFFDLRHKTLNATRSNSEYNKTYYRYICACSGNPPPKEKQEPASRAQRTSPKYNCGFNITASHPMKSDNSG